MQRIVELVLIAALSACPFCSRATAQEKPAPASAASLLEQGKFAEEQQRDFQKAIALYTSSLKAAREAKNEQAAALATAALNAASARQAGIAGATQQGVDDPLTCRIAERMFNLVHFESRAQQESSYRDLALFGALAVPWLEKAIQGEYTLCDQVIDDTNDPPLYVRALAQMNAPEGVVALEKLLSSSDPIVRRAVVEFAEVERHRALLQRALKDPAKAVRDQALETLTGSSDPALLETMRSFAREGNSAALSWLRRKPDELLSIATDEKLGLQTREEALERLTEDGARRPSVADVDVLLALARGPADPALRNRAMSLLIKGVEALWKPLPAGLSQRIEAAILAAPDSFPQEYVVRALVLVGGPASLATLIERPSSDESGRVNNAIQNIVSASSPKDFPAIAAAFARAANPNDSCGQAMFNWLQVNAPFVSGTVLAAGAAALPPAHRRAYLERVTTAWISEHTANDLTIAQLPKFEKELIALLREKAASSNSNLSDFGIRGLGASGDPSVLPFLVGLVQSDELRDEIRVAIQRLTRSDPGRIKTVLGLLLGSDRLSARGIGSAFSDIIERKDSKATLAAVEAAWSPANAERLIALVTTAVPGPEGSAFLQSHYPALDVSASDTRTRVIQRFGDELYDPALEIIGAALRDSNDRVRNTAAAAFARFKTAREQFSEFEAWRAAAARDTRTTTELTALLANESPEVVAGAIKALTALEARSALPQIIAVLQKHKDDSSVKDAVQQAIDALAK